MITTKQIELIRESFPAVARMGEIFAFSFRQRALQLDPDLRAVFSGNVQSSAGSFISGMAFLVAHLDRWHEIHADLQSMGRRHSRAGIRDDQYPVLAAALKWTLEQQLGAGARPEIMAAWDALLRVAAKTMTDAAEDMRSGGYSTALFAQHPPERGGEQRV